MDRDDDEEEATVEMIVASALMRGLTLSDLDNMTLGGLIDYVITYNELNDYEKDTEKQAKQSDFDNF